eukprot:bmy_08995T0
MVRRPDWKDELGYLVRCLGDAEVTVTQDIFSRGERRIRSTVNCFQDYLCNSVKAREGWNVPEQWTGPNTAPADPVLPSTLSQLPATHRTREESEEKKKQNASKLTLHHLPQEAPEASNTGVCLCPWASDSETSFSSQASLKLEERISSVHHPKSGSDTTWIPMLNAKDFLQDLKFVPSDEKQKQGCQ